ncbi:neutral zinc metallopeptidase [Kribbella sp. CA-247076]|uniref:neutral zinc metallopeptidase n=1 Tax=Kribbella sp. CA-247076 TaxID=3239941 RepID=UPI003D8F307D
MSGTARTGALVVVAALVAVLAGTAARPEQSIVTGATASATPTAESSPTPSVPRASTPAVAPSSVPLPTVRRTSPTVRRTTSGLANWEANAQRDALVLNRIYAAGKVPSVSCPLPTARLGSKAAVVRYVNAILACLDRAWAPVMERASLYFQPAEFHPFKDKVDTPCGREEEHVGFYCSTGYGIYIDWSAYTVPRRTQLSAEVALIYVTAHEYGHHLQQLAGIMQYYVERYYDKKGDARLQDNRRMELQATCFASLFFKANQRTLRLSGTRYRQLTLGEGGDEDFPDTPRDHGSRKSMRIWELGAFESGDLGSCNTWAAPTGKVT